MRGLLGSGARGGCIQWRGWLPPLWALAAAYAPLPKILVCGRDFHEWAPRFGSRCCRGRAASALVGLTVRSGAGNGDGRVPISVHCLQIERPFRESSQWEKGSFLPRNGLDARPIFLRGGGDGERRWAAPIPAVWGAAGGGAGGGKLDERFLRARPPPPHRSLPFFPDLHTEVCRSWGRPYSSRLFIPASNYYGNVVGLDECGYRAMPKVEQTLASYLSPHVASSLKAPALPTKPLRTTSTLVGRGYSAAGQAGACLHTMSVLQAYQADLLKELDEREQVSSDDIAELRRTADLSLSAPLRRPPVPLGALWLLWWQRRDICGWPCQIWRTKTGSAYWTPRSRLLACSATLSTRLSTGFRRRVSKRQRWETWEVTMCWCGPTTQRWSLTSTTRGVCARARCTNWHTRSSCGPRTSSSHWEHCIFLGTWMWDQTYCRDRGRGPGNGCFTPRWWSRYGECFIRRRWTSSQLEWMRNVPSGSL